jgi:hypothetical protein
MMAKNNKRPQSKPNGNIWRRRFYELLCYVAKAIPENGQPESVLKAIIGRAQHAMGNREHNVPDTSSEILAFVMRAGGADENEVAQAIDELTPASTVASMDGVSVETVQENRKQFREARKQHGFFSSEAKSARQDLRRDRRESRRARRRAGGGVSAADVISIGAKLL